ncbi:hypothetical protein SAMN04515691_2977 [Leifsonia sp. 98AMF]|uniref:hypothetical protein n=1 Tax=unclassified Leifsonia TaxID=2663824 RepID=UPI000879EFBB|nr:MULTISPECIES: hypothetical protein [unclassified Leifsonia]SDH16336.1 hypothetical protein SAMN04515690_1039 [Leifsonia sp. 197AMF]SDJ21949.1 hypothetical protein SAMN04515684_2743 [Leifsonia sp. 466MF]SDK61809.1 hypothetical protein SAMN04515683_4021 [Leifsonia sp. 157MF]SDN43632.1 hypothetical protein SAMN04515686_0927 [Leifsonia sp. 509MF]SEN67520.1 hypothetical protein SAMN04515685_4002 [Leifsonia sp. 467MF]
MNNSSDRYRAAVQAHLDIVRKHHQQQVAEERQFARYALMYGFTVPEIADGMGLTAPYVRRLLIDQ